MTEEPSQPPKDLIAEQARKSIEMSMELLRLSTAQLHAARLHVRQLERQVAAYGEDLAGHQETILRREAEVRELAGQPMSEKPTTQ